MCILRDETSLETYGFPDFGKLASLFCVKFTCPQISHPAVR